MLCRVSCTYNGWNGERGRGNEGHMGDRWEYEYEYKLRTGERYIYNEGKGERGLKGGMRG